MATYEVVQPDGHKYQIKRSDQDKMKLDTADMSPEQVKLLAKVEAAKADGTTAPLPKCQPGQHRELPGKRNTSHLWAALRFLGLDGW